VEKRVAIAIPYLKNALPGYREFLHFSSPKTNTDSLKCPVFLFHAQDDDNIPIRETTDFAAQLEKTNSKVTLVTSPTGGHYNSMVSNGIPKALAWLKELQGERR
jgi:dipeptidyl aminopeptidase/acylaminoacyl peptidase